MCLQQSKCFSENRQQHSISHKSERFFSLFNSFFFSNIWLNNEANMATRHSAPPAIIMPTENEHPPTIQNGVIVVPKKSGKKGKNSRTIKKQESKTYPWPAFESQPHTIE